MTERRQELSRDALLEATKKIENDQPFSWTKEHVTDLIVLTDLVGTGAATVASERWEIAATGSAIAIGVIGIKKVSQMIGGESNAENPKS